MAASGRKDIAKGHFIHDMANFYAEFLTADACAREAGEQLLTPAGLRYCRRLSLGTPETMAALALSSSSDVKYSGPTRLPRWDAETRRLWLGGKLLKEFR